MGSGVSKETVLTMAERSKKLEHSMQRNSDFYSKNLNEFHKSVYESKKQNLEETVILLNEALNNDKEEEISQAYSLLQDIAAVSTDNPTQWKLTVKALGVDIVNTNILSRSVEKAKIQYQDGTLPMDIISFIVEWADGSKEFSYEFCKTDGAISFLIKMLNNLNEALEVSERKLSFILI